VRSPPDSSETYPASLPVNELLGVLPLNSNDARWPSSAQALAQREIEKNAGVRTAEDFGVRERSRRRRLSYP